jgi:hypothetical protein
MHEIKIHHGTMRVVSNLNRALNEEEVNLVRLLTNRARELEIVLNSGVDDVEKQALKERVQRIIAERDTLAMPVPGDYGMDGTPTNLLRDALLWYTRPDTQRYVGEYNRRGLSEKNGHYDPESMFVRVYSRLEHEGFVDAADALDDPITVNRTLLFEQVTALSHVLEAGPARSEETLTKISGAMQILWELVMVLDHARTFAVVEFVRGDEDSNE